MTTDKALASTKSLPQGTRFSLPFLWKMVFEKNYNLWSFFEENRIKHGDVARFPLMITKPAFQVTDPDLIGRLLMGTEKSNKKTVFIDRMKKVAGNGIFLSRGETWKANRRLANPAFHPRMVERMRSIVDEEITSMLNEWEKRIEEDPVLNISSEMSKLMLNTVMRILFSTELKHHAKAISDAMNSFQDYSTYIYYNPIDIPLWVPLPIHLRLKKVNRVFDDITFGLINEHRAHPDRYQDLLSVYLSTVDEETGAKMDDRQVRDEVLTLMAAGYETTAGSLSMGFHALCAEPEATRRIVEDDESMSYTNLATQEILRLYPSVWGISRELTEPLEFKDVLYPIGTNFVLLQQHMHRHPAHWSNPEVFDPNRFLPENSKGRHPFAYFPFGGGARNCIGMGLAKLEMNMVISRCLKRFRMETVPGRSHVLKPLLTTMAKPGVFLKVSKL